MKSKSGRQFLININVPYDRLDKLGTKGWPLTTNPLHAGHSGETCQDLGNILF